MGSDKPLPASNWDSGTAIVVPAQPTECERYLAVEPHSRITFDERGVAVDLFAAQERFAAHEYLLPRFPQSLRAERVVGLRPKHHDWGGALSTIEDSVSDDSRLVYLCSSHSELPLGVNGILRVEFGSFAVADRFGDLVERLNVDCGSYGIFGARFDLTTYGIAVPANANVRRYRPK